MVMTPAPKKDALFTAWIDTTEAISARTRQDVEAAVKAKAHDLAEQFYAAMFADDEAQHLLDHQVVNHRLRGSLERWLLQLFSAAVPWADVIAVQRRTGEVHARIGVPSHLVARGARVLKRSISKQLMADDMARDDLAKAISYVHEVVDLAVDVMDTAYTSNANRMTRSDEAYRLFFLSQNMRAERERQKLQLLEWAQEILVSYYWEAPPNGMQHDVTSVAGRSQFAMWLRHKASILFEGSPEIGTIQQHIETIEATLLPRLGHARASRDDARALVAEINQTIDCIKGLLATMFDRYIEGEDGSDSVTNLLNRRYLPSVAKREIALAQAQGGGFAMLVVDIDGFRHVRDALGLDSADLVLQQVGSVLVDHLRAGDFVFRIGDEQFLALVVDCVADSLMPLANGLRERVAATRLRTPEQASTQLTVSIGVAEFDGHPDYQRLLDRAIDAVGQAKAAGGNVCVHSR